MTVEIKRDGGRRVHFFVTQTPMGKQLQYVDVDPCRLDHVLRWNDGQIESSLMLLSELTRLTEFELQHLTFPDADRLMAAFLEVLPETIRDDINAGRRPVATGSPAPAPAEPDEDMARALNGGGGAPREPSPAEAQAEALRLASAGEDEDAGFDLMR